MTDLSQVPTRDGATFDMALDGQRLARQHDKVFAYMKDGAWHSLATVARATGAPEASCSSRLRDFRKPKFGGHTVEHRRGGWNNCWEYRLILADRELFE